MAIDLAVLRTELRVHLGYEEDGTDDLSDNDADLLLNRAMWELMNKFNFREEEKSATFPAVDGTEFYSLPTLFESVRNISLQDADNTETWFPLDRTSLDEYTKNLDDADTNEGMPLRYFREDNGIRLNPIPDKATYTIKVKYRVTLADLAAGNTTLIIPDVWHELILMGGHWRGLHRLRDYESAREVRNVQIGLINSTVEVESKEEVDSPLAGIEIPRELTQI